MKYLLIGDAIYRTKYLIGIEKKEEFYVTTWEKGPAIQVILTNNSRKFHPFETAAMRDQMFDLIYSQLSKKKPVEPSAPVVVTPVSPKLHNNCPHCDEYIRNLPPEATLRQVKCWHDDYWKKIYNIK